MSTNGVIQIISDTLGKGGGSPKCHVTFFFNFEPYFCIWACLQLVISTLFLEKLKRHIQGGEEGGSTQRNVTNHT
jgi:hypothetical protein